MAATSLNFMFPFSGQESDLGSENQLSGQQKASFSGGFSIFILQPGKRLSRYIHSKEGPYFSDCWVDEQTTSEIYRAIQNVQNYSADIKKDVLRRELAILEGWKNNLDFRVKVQIQTETIAYVGVAGIQDLYAKSSTFSPFGEAFQRLERKIGGLTQFVIPSFKGLKTENSKASIVHLAEI
jgi:hypothetical protein